MDNLVRNQTGTELVEEKSAVDDFIVLNVVSESMYPLIEKGDSIVVESVDANELRTGDIIVFKRNNTFCTHRFIGNNGNNYLITKGDRFKKIDEPVHISQLFARLRTVYGYSYSYHQNQQVNRILNLKFGLLLKYQQEILKKNNSPFIENTFHIFNRVFTLLWRILLECIYRLKKK